MSPVELTARKNYEDWQKAMAAAFDATATKEMKAEAGAETWKKVIIQVRTAYADQGLTAEQALGDVARAQETAQGSTQRSAAAIAHINAILAEQARQTALVTEAVQAYGLTWRDLDEQKQGKLLSESMDDLIEKHDLLIKKGYNEDAVIKGMAASMNEFLVDSVRLGTKIPASMQPMIDQMIKMGLVTEDAARALMGMGTDTMPKLEDITAAAERYGLTLDQLGAKVNQLDIDKRAKQAVDDFKILQDAGVDTGLVIGAMSEKAQQLVTDALKFGATLPEGMKPILEAMAASGELTDDAAEKMQDLSLDLRQALTEMFDTLIKKVGELVDAITAQLSPALEGIAPYRPTSSGASARRHSDR